MAIIDNRVYGQSNDILLALEEKFPKHKSLQPPEGKETKGNQLLRLERQLFSAWMYWLTSRGNAAGFRQEFIETLSIVEDELKRSDGPFFMGKTVTTVDFMFAPFLERMAASLCYYKGFVFRVPPNTATDFPHVNKWFDAMETLESYQFIKSDYYTHCWDLPPQLGGCTSEPAGEPYRKAINGEQSILDGKRGSWELPLEPHCGGIEPDWEWAGDEMASRREAVERVSANHEAIVKFAARGAGKKGMPPVSAPLADPNAVPSEAVEKSVDSIMRVVCLALLDGTENHRGVLSELGKLIKDNGNSEFVEGVVTSLSYVRDRVGVPRDMRLPAARQLRAHLNWAIKTLSSS